MGRILPKMHRLGHWFAFAAIACWLGGSTRNTLMLWLLALVSLLLAPWVVGGGFAEWALGADGQRIDFGLHNAQHTAMLFGTALIGLLVLAPRLIRTAKGFSSPAVAVAGLLWLAAVAICMLAVLYSQTRAVWLGLLVAALFLCGVGLRAAFLKYGSNSWPRLLAATALCIALLGALGARFGDIVAERLGYESDTINLVLAGNIEAAPYTSTGIRVHSWMEALSWIQERPLLGWGGKGRSLVIEHSESMPRHLKDTIGHLHNSYLDLQVNNGLLGSLLFLALLIWLLRAAVRTWRRGELPGDLLLFFLCFILYWLVTNCFESYLFFASGSYVFGLVCAGVATHILRAGFPARGIGKQKTKH
ncbi:O-antigen ligase family protein [Microbulbifer taiwanensis]|uniref:O-antigen ligase family protein n=1 Tax=Microbulbifer taiwanensis TaxID=986746 RepID=UPI0036713C0C